MKVSAQILFHSEDTPFTLKKSEKIVNVLLKFIEEEANYCGSINYVFCSDDYLLKLNQEYLSHDYYTDILSFQMDDEPIQGDIFISIDRVTENARNLNVPFEDELYRVISHGVLHFLGYKDKTQEEIQIMRKKEDELIERIKKNQFKI